MSGQPPPNSSVASLVTTSSPSAPQQTSNISMAGISMAEQNQPVDLVTTNKQPLRIPTVPRPNLNLAVGPRGPPSSSGGLGSGPVAILGTAPNHPSGGSLRSGPVSRPPLLAVPKATTQQQQVNFAVMNNKVTVLTSTPPAKGTPLTAGTVPRATATTIIRPPTSFPLTMKTQSSVGPTGMGPGSGNTSIRLTTATPAASASVQLVPMNIAANIRPQGGSMANPSAVRPGVSIPSSRGPASFRPAVASTMSDAVRVTLVQSPGGNMSKAPSVGGAATITSTTTGFYKQVTITPPGGNPQKITAAPPAPSGPTMRIGGTLQPSSASSRMTVLPANAGPGGPLQTVSLAPTSAQQINVPLTAGTKGIMAGRGIINVPTGSGTLGSNPTAVGPPGVTIQKTSIPLSSPRTLALPYGTSTQVAAIPKPVSQAIPVARVVPQQNVVTITTTVGGSLPPSTGQPGSVYIARTNTPGGGMGQPVAINLSNNPTQILKQSSVGSGQMNSNIIGAKITAPSTSAARLVNLPQQQLPIHMDPDKLTSSPSRPSILRRREGERDNVMPDTPPPRPDSRNDDAGSSSSGSTTLSATSSPGMAVGDRANMSGGEESNNVLQPNLSPRKKPRKQSLTSNVRASEQQQWEQEEEEIQLKRKLPKTRETQIPHQVSQPKLPASHYIRNQPHMSLLNSYRHTWKSRHNHFLKHSDVRPREDPRSTVNELAAQKHIRQKINGWKIYHLTSQMGDVIDMENELTSRLANLQKKLEKNAVHEVTKDVGKIQELIKANLQRSKVIQDQVKEAKDHALDLFEHKGRVSSILDKYMSKRSVKKRDLK